MPRQRRDVSGFLQHGAGLLRPHPHSGAAPASADLSPRDPSVLRQTMPPDACVLCAHRGAWRLGFGQTDRAILLCERCGHAWTSWPPAGPIEHAPAPNRQRAHQVQAGLLATQRLAALSGHLPRSASLLNLIADGGALVWLGARHGFRVTDRETAAGPFDAVLMSARLAAAANPVQALVDIAQRMRRGGMALIEMPNLLDPGLSPRRLLDGQGRHCFSAVTLPALARAAGLRPVAVRPVQGRSVLRMLALAGSHDDAPPAAPAGTALYPLDLAQWLLRQQRPRWTDRLQRVAALGLGAASTLGAALLASGASTPAQRWARGAAWGRWRSSGG
jgi:hypothetical protein